MNKSVTLSQQDFLKFAMEELAMTPEQFADRLGTTLYKLDRWMLPSESRDFLEMDVVIWKFVREIVASSHK